MKKVILSLFFCLFFVTPIFAEELTPGQIGFLTREPWYEDEVGYGWVTYPDSPLNDDLPYDYVYVETEYDPLPEGFIHTQSNDGLIGLFSMNWRPDPIMPDEDLPNYTTKELLDIFLGEAPMQCLHLFSINNYMSETGDAIESHIESLRWQYNVVDELLKRPDLTEVLFDMYYPGCNSDAIEFFMIADQLKYGEYSLLQKATIVTQKEKISNLSAKTNIYPQHVGIYDSYVMSTGRFDCNFPVPSLAIGAGSNYTVRTLVLPTGGTVEVLDDRSPDLNAIEIQIARVQYENNLKYAGIVFISNPTVKYNCHSYAWYAQSTSNHYWIESPAGFKSSTGNYKLISQSEAKSGDVVYWSNGKHSAALRYSISENVVWCTSKWGQDALYEHRSDVCPYDICELYFYTKK